MGFAASELSLTLPRSSGPWTRVNMGVVDAVLHHIEMVLGYLQRDFQSKVVHPILHDTPMNLLPIQLPHLFFKG